MMLTTQFLTQRLNFNQSIEALSIIKVLPEREAVVSGEHLVSSSASLSDRDTDVEFRSLVPAPSVPRRGECVTTQWWGSSQGRQPPHLTVCCCPLTLLEGVLYLHSTQHVGPELGSQPEQHDSRLEETLLCLELQAGLGGGLLESTGGGGKGGWALLLNLPPSSCPICHPSTQTWSVTQCCCILAETFSDPILSGRCTTECVDGSSPG